MLFQDVIFWFLAVAAIAASLGVVLVKDLFRAALLLVVVFVVVAGFFVLLSAEFLAVVQVLIYAGAISILIIFAVMLTRDVQRGNMPNRLQIPAVLLSALLLSALVVVATDTNWNLFSDSVSGEEQERVELVQTRSVSILTISELSDETLRQAGLVSEEEQAAAELRRLEKSSLGDLLIGDFVLPFEVVSVLLLAALIGALVLVRPRPPESPR
jgi:NADH:ubiquinone oxidoreductase subunit 6 (subunit J)